MFGSRILSQERKILGGWPSSRGCAVRWRWFQDDQFLQALKDPRRGRARNAQYQYTPGSRWKKLNEGRRRSWAAMQCQPKLADVTETSRTRTAGNPISVPTRQLPPSAGFTVDGSTTRSMTHRPTASLDI